MVTTYVPSMQQRNTCRRFNELVDQEKRLLIRASGALRPKWVLECTKGALAIRAKRQQHILICPVCKRLEAEQ